MSDFDAGRRPPPPGPPPYQGPAPYPGPAAVYPEASQATTVIVLGLLSFLVCGLLAPFAWYLGNRELQAIDAGMRPPDQRSMAEVGRILGMVMTLLAVGSIVLGLLALLLFIPIGIATS